MECRAGNCGCALAGGKCDGSTRLRERVLEDALAVKGGASSGLSPKLTSTLSDIGCPLTGGRCADVLRVLGDSAVAGEAGAVRERMFGVGGLTLTLTP
jgi:hypothetical protein